MTLDDVASGDASASDALDLVSASLVGASAEAAKSVYTVLRAWTWKAINGRRRDEELRAWYDVLRRAHAWMHVAHPELAAGVRALYELVYESISVAEVLPVAELMGRGQAVKLLDALLSAGDDVLDERALARRTGLELSSAKRLLTMLCSSGLVERTWSGPQPVLRLSAQGRKEMTGSAGQRDYYLQRAGRGGRSAAARPAPRPQGPGMHPTAHAPRTDAPERAANHLEQLGEVICWGWPPDPSTLTSSERQEASRLTNAPFRPRPDSQTGGLGRCVIVKLGGEGIVDEHPSHDTLPMPDRAHA